MSTAAQRRISQAALRANPAFAAREARRAKELAAELDRVRKAAKLGVKPVKRRRHPSGIYCYSPRCWHCRDLDRYLRCRSGKGSLRMRRPAAVIDPLGRNWGSTWPALEEAMRKFGPPCVTLRR